MQWVTTIPEKKPRRVSPVSIITATVFALLLLFVPFSHWLKKVTAPSPTSEPALPNVVTPIKPVSLPPFPSPTPTSPATPVPLGVSTPSYSSPATQAPSVVSGNIPETGPVGTLIVISLAGISSGFWGYHALQQKKLRDAWRSTSVLS